jgi:hypothetical protein
MLKIGDVLRHKNGEPPVEEPKKWLGDKPEKCDLCGTPLAQQAFVDGKTQMGPWGIMCRPCHKTKGMGLGLGRGQLYNYLGIKMEG